MKWAIQSINDVEVLYKSSSAAIVVECIKLLGFGM
jgi:hypothetical protein